MALIKEYHRYRIDTWKGRKAVRQCTAPLLTIDSRSLYSSQSASSYLNTRYQWGVLFDLGLPYPCKNAAQRINGGVTKWNATYFRCYNAKNFGGDNQAPCSDNTVGSVALLNKAEPGGIQTTIRFPTCANFVSLWPSRPDAQGHIRLWVVTRMESIRKAQTTRAMSHSRRLVHLKIAGHILQHTRSSCRRLWRELVLGLHAIHFRRNLIQRLINARLRIALAKTSKDIGHPSVQLLKARD